MNLNKRFLGILGTSADDHRPHELITDVIDMLKRISFISLFITVTLSLLPWTPARELSAKIKRFVRLRVTASVQDFNAPPMRLISFGEAGQLRHRITQIETFRVFDDGSLIASSTEAKIDLILKTLSQQKNTRQVCGTYTDLTDLRASLDQGCCSDYARIFQALAESLQIPVRTIVTPKHVFSEYWSALTGQWVFVDPWISMRISKAGRYLSATELHDATADSEVESQFQPMASDRKFSLQLLGQYYQDPVNFEKLYLRTGRTILEQDAFDHPLRWLPRAVRQMIGIVLGKSPRELLLTDRVWTHRILSAVIDFWLLFSIVPILITILNAVSPIKIKVPAYSPKGEVTLVQEW